jgi:CubicO group peptidase (beta-lactamase class C family)
MPRRVQRFLLLLAILSSFPSLTLRLGVSWAEQPAFDGAKLAEVPRRMEELVKSGQISGAVTLVATKDRVVHLAAVGKADVASGRAMEPDAIFRVASMTKPITSTALMMLVEQGKLNVDDPVS